ncbi:MAG TPA: hypothetical protein DEB25_05835 [Desulfobulbaceae bacterium]|nr:hypothetical protein [Desulfobulbaceae bacterium]
MEVRIEDQARAEQALRAHYLKTTCLSDHTEGQAETPSAAVANACPACGTLAPPEQGHCPDCGIRLA